MGAVYLKVVCSVPQTRSDHTHTLSTFSAFPFSLPHSSSDSSVGMTAPPPNMNTSRPHVCLLQKMLHVMNTSCKVAILFTKSQRWSSQGGGGLFQLLLTSPTEKKRDKPEVPPASRAAPLSRSQTISNIILILLENVQVLHVSCFTPNPQETIQL